MSYKFTAEEIAEVIRVGRIYGDGFNEGDFQSLLEMKGHLKEDGYLEATEGLARLAKEGVPCTQALEEYQERIQRRTELEGQISNLEVKLSKLAEKNQQADEGLQQIKQSTQRVQQELAEVRAIRVKEEQELTVFRQEIAREKERLNEELVQCRQETKVSQGEIETAAKLKAEIESYGFTLELIFGLAQEFRGHEKVREELAGALKKHQTLTGYNAALELQTQERKKAGQAELDWFKAQKEGQQIDIKNLKAASLSLEGQLYKLQEDKADEDNLRSFYRRYCSVIGLMDYLAGWDEVYFLRCTNPMSAVTGYFVPRVKNARFCTDKPAIKCPHCGLTTIAYDEKAYQALGRLIGDPRKIILGE